MTTKEKTLTKDVLALSRKSRVALAKKLLQSLEQEQIILEGARIAEERFEAYRRGEMKGIPAEEVFPALRKKGKR
ncbi:MAG: addiction module protein [Gemmataceae bacterium]|nr:addiction module protein [Gemmataceae bacterium]